MKTLFYIFLVLGFTIKGICQSFVEPDRMKSFNVTVNYPDYMVKTQMLKDSKKIKPETDLSYHWYVSQKIIETKGDPKASKLISEGLGGGQSSSSSSSSSSSLKFNDVDTAVDKSGNEELITAPKTLERLEEISNLRNIQRKMDEEDDDDEKLKISNENIDLGSLDIQNLEPSSMNLNSNLLLTDIEVLA